MLKKVWSGVGQMLDAETLSGVDATFEKHVLTPADVLVLKVAGDPPREFGVQLLRVIDDSTLQVAPQSGEDLGQLENEPLELTVLREVQQPCTVCAQAGLVAESDHQHCMWTNQRLHKDYPYFYSESARQLAVSLLRDKGDAVQSVRMGHNREVTLRCLTYQENDLLLEWADYLTSKNTAEELVAQLLGQGRLALALINDGAGRSPLKSLKPEEHAAKSQDRLPLLLSFFKHLPDVYVLSLVAAVGRLEGLVAEVCAEDLNDEDFSQDERLHLCDALITAGPQSPPILGEVKLFNKTSPVVFQALSNDETSRVSQWLVEMQRKLEVEQAVTFSVHRKRNFDALVYLAANFVADARKQFDPRKSTLEERVSYLATLPMPLFYMYVRAASLFRQRCNAATEMSVVGNF
jgi:hypothetical protein